jgi:hypothetical protein
LRLSSQRLFIEGFPEKRFRPSTVGNGLSVCRLPSFGN